ncbi:MAG: L-aspartate oxidase [Chloroflexi bacterium]|nr:L-aspartate oxidase [Chloroflexota bacterium]
MKKYETDVLIIGTGGAGLYAAIRAAEEGVRVLVWDKGLVGRGGSTVGGAGVSAVGPWSRPGDGSDVQFRDTVTGGAYLNDQPLVRTLVEEAQERITELEGWGLKFDRDPDGGYVLDQAGGHSFPRVMAISDRVGLQMVKVLRNQARKRENIHRHPDVMAYQLLLEDGAMVGGIGLDVGAGEVIRVDAPAVVLATGGIGQLYPTTSNPIQSTGDGLALASRVGARMLNMEQVQFYPSGLVHPSSLKGFILGIQEYSSLYNRENERFMRRYEPELLEHTTRDKLARAIYTEILEGRGTEHGGVYLDVTTIPEETFHSFQHEYEVAKDRGFDMQKVRVEVAPAAHYYMGGIAIESDGCTSVPGLFAAGEVSGGVQGGNRLSGNSLAGILVFGARAGTSAARYAQEQPRIPDVAQEAGKQAEERLHHLAQRGEGELTPAQGKDRLRAVMWEGVGLIRTEEGLRSAQEEIDSLREEILPRISLHGPSLLQNQSLVAYLELENMLTAADLIIQSALARRESRGAHYREDFPHEENPPLCVEAVLEGGTPTISKRSPQLTELSPSPNVGRNGFSTGGSERLHEEVAQ